MKDIILILSVCLLFVSCGSDNDNNDGGGDGDAFYYDKIGGSLKYPDNDNYFTFLGTFNKDMTYYLRIDVRYDMVNMPEEKEKYIVYIKGNYSYSKNKDRFIVKLDNAAYLKLGVTYYDGTNIGAEKNTDNLESVFPVEYEVYKEGKTVLIKSVDTDTDIIVK